MAEDKEKRAAEAKAHVDEMAAKFAPEISVSVQNSVVYSDPARLLMEEDWTRVAPSEEVRDIDSVSAVFEYSKEGKGCVLNFASYKKPGGEFLSGAIAQEESLCHESTLYNVLSMKQPYYLYNIGHTNRSLYTDRALYSPDIVFQRGKDVVKADVLTCAAPNFSAASKYQHVSRQENEVSLLNRVRFLLLIAKEQKPDVLILGAFGCGVFGQDPDVIAKMLHEEVQRLCPARKVVYAVPGEKSEENLKAFRKNIR